MFKVADFKNQELVLDVYSESPNVSYHEEHLSMMETIQSERSASLKDPS